MLDILASLTTRIWVSLPMGEWLMLFAIAVLLIASNVALVVTWLRLRSEHRKIGAVVHPGGSAFHCETCGAPAIVAADQPE